MKSITLHLIRHGATKANEEGRYLGHTDWPLSENGKREIEELKKNYDYPQSDFVFSSPLSRATQTAEILYPDCTPMIINDFIEYNFGDFDTRTADDLFKKAPLFERWLKGEPGVKPPFGEGNLEFANRICNCFKTLVNGLIKENIDNAVVVTHAGVISTLLYNFGLPLAELHQWSTDPGTGYSLKISPSIWSSTNKAEVVDRIPVSIFENQSELDKWDYYPNVEDDYDISDDIYNDYDPFTEGKI